MALIKCPECGRDVAADAPSCPNCGTPIAARREATQRVQTRSRRNAFVFILGLVFFVIIGNAITNSKPTTSSSSAMAVPESAVSSTVSGTPARRAAFADQYERSMLSQGKDVKARVSGPGNRTFTLTWVLAGRPLAYQMANDEKIMANLQELGFRKVVVTDGYDETYSFTVDPLPGDTAATAKPSGPAKARPRWIADPKLEVFYYTNAECGPAQALLKRGGYQTFASASEALDAGYRRSDAKGCDD